MCHSALQALKLFTSLTPMSLLDRVCASQTPSVWGASKIADVSTVIWGVDFCRLSSGLHMYTVAHVTFTPQ